MKMKRIEQAPGRPYDALLIDLDGTLLQLDVDQFVPAYFNSLSEYFSEIFSPDIFFNNLLAATKAMLARRNSEKTNEAAFYNDLCRRLGMERTALSPLIEKFYEQEFPRLRSWSAPRTHAPSVLEAAQRRSLKLVLATQPVFPRRAAIERLSWAGLSESPFDLITTVENMHYCKPHREYYLEISRKIGIPPERCLMAGNDTLEDICAAKAGMGTFLVEGGIIDHGAEIPPFDYRGTLEELALMISEDFEPVAR